MRIRNVFVPIVVVSLFALLACSGEGDPGIAGDSIDGSCVELRFDSVTGEPIAEPLSIPSSACKSPKPPANTSQQPMKSQGDCHVICLGGCCSGAGNGKALINEWGPIMGQCICECGDMCFSA